MSAVVQGKLVILVIASNGFQQVEYQNTKQVLEQNGITVITASNKMGGAVAKDNSTAFVDVALDKIDLSKCDGIFFIGGPGALEHLDNATSYKLLQEAKRRTIPYGAICISPRILATAGVLKGVNATGWDEDLELAGLFKARQVIYNKKPVVIDGIVVTADGPNSATAFGQAIVRVLTEKSLSK
jgi:protease I